MLEDDRLIPLLLAVLWPVRTALDPCPLRTALWFTGLARAEVDELVIAAAARLLDGRHERGRS